MSEPPKVVHVSNIGKGTIVLLGPQCEYLRNLGYDVSFVFSPDLASRDILVSRGFQVYEVPIPRSISPLCDAVAVVRLLSVFRSIKPDLVHTHTSKGGAIGRIAAWLAGVPRVVHTIHGFPFIEGQNAAKYHLYSTAERGLARLTDTLLSQSMEDVDTAKRFGIRSRTGYPMYLGNGVNTALFSPSKSEAERRCIRAELGIADEPVITIIARLTMEKGYSELISALSDIRSARWTALFVGEDDCDASEINKMLCEKGLSDRVRMLGYCTDIVRLLSVTDIYVLPSHREGVPRSVIEAQAMGIPAVVTDIRGCNEIVVNEKTGYLVPPRDSNRLARAMYTLLNHEERRRLMGRAARERVLTNFDERLVFERLSTVYESLLNR